MKNESDTKWKIITKRTLVLKGVVCYNPVKGVLGIKIKEVEKCITQL